MTGDPAYLIRDSEQNAKEILVNKKPHGAGNSSFDLVDVERLFAEIALQKGNIFLDIACGSGAYSKAAANIVGSSGRSTSSKSVSLSKSKKFDPDFDCDFDSHQAAGN
jgi:hypothetical protein